MTDVRTHSRPENDDMIATSLWWAVLGILTSSLLYLAGTPWYVVAWVALIGFAPMLGAAIHVMGE